MPLELLASDATIWSIAEELSITILVTSFSLSYAVYSTGITYDDHQLTIIICLQCWPWLGPDPKEMLQNLQIGPSST
jgi:hypothetical protein